MEMNSSVESITIGGVELSTRIGIEFFADMTRVGSVKVGEICQALRKAHDGAEFYGPLESFHVIISCRSEDLLHLYPQLGLLPSESFSLSFGMFPDLELYINVPIRDRQDQLRNNRPAAEELLGPLLQIGHHTHLISWTGRTNRSRLG